MMFIKLFSSSMCTHLLCRKSLLDNYCDTILSAPMEGTTCDIGKVSNKKS